jgi:hypothetical protein
MLPLNRQNFVFRKMNGFAFIKGSVAEPHHFYVAPAPSANFNPAPAAPAPAPTLLHSKAKFLKRTKV